MNLISSQFILPLHKETYIVEPVSRGHGLGEDSGIIREILVERSTFITHLLSLTSTTLTIILTNTNKTDIHLDCDLHKAVVGT